ncbi:Multidrug resistance protein MdtC [Carnimonas sp. R-84981]|uniref:efflux RND transporter permease subunit n=1 Tax=Carnimonas bestiolae TaxID=3402172 RepID=UPI003EDBC46C
MNITAPFIKRPIATILLSVATLLLGGLAWFMLPVAPLPDMRIPVIMVNASLSGANPDTMASTVAAPLERSLGQISGIKQISSTSSEGGTQIVVQFKFGKNIDEAAREVQAAINSAQALLPTAMRSRPSYRKVNPTDAPILLMSLSSPRLSQGELYQLADRTISPRLLRISGVGSISVGGSSSPAIRVGVDPFELQHAGISLDTVRNVLDNANSLQPNGNIDSGDKRLMLGTNSQLFNASDYRSLIVHSSDNGRRILHLGDVAEVSEGVENPYSAGFYNQRSAVILVVRPTADANIVDTVDQIRAELPNVTSLLPEATELNVTMDRSPGIRASLTETQLTLIIGVLLVVGVIFLFLRSLRPTLIPGVAIPITLIGTFAAIYMCGYTLNTMTLMALIVSVGFVVDDAIVVVENVARHIDRGEPPFSAALKGSAEISFTVVSMTLSLVAVLIPIMLLPDLLGLLFSSFAATLMIALLISMVVSLTLTPMMCAYLFASRHTHKVRRPERWLIAMGNLVQRGYAATLAVALKHHRLTLLSLFAVIGLNGYLFVVVPKAFVPTQDTGRIQTSIRPDQSLGFSATRDKIEQVRDVLMKDPRVESVAGYVSTGGRHGGGASAFMSLSLKDDRDADTQTIANQLTQRVSHFAGLRIGMFAAEDIGGGSGNGQYDLTLRSDSVAQLNKYADRVTHAMDSMPQLTGVTSDHSANGQALNLVVNRERASALGISMRDVDTLLENSFAQRQVSSVYRGTDQYYVIMHVKEDYQSSADSLSHQYLVNNDGKQIPITAFAHVERSVSPVEVNHLDQFASISISFNLADGVVLGDATEAIKHKVDGLMLPGDIIVDFNGSASDFESSSQAMPWILLAALATVYLVLGILYESYIHPFTILSTLPSAGVGALLALLLVKEPFTMVAMISLVLLIGVVKKNAILLVDFALHAERHYGKSPQEAITEAALVRFRPIMMTTMAAILGAVPLLIGHDENAAYRYPLGVTIVGGLIVSQLLTLYTTPVVYLYFDKLRYWRRSKQ